MVAGEYRPKTCICELCDDDVEVLDGNIRITCPDCGRVFSLDGVLLKDQAFPSDQNNDNNCTCLCCGYSWESNVENPKRCPRCGSYKWNVVPRKYTCLRCGHRWTTRNDGEPYRCPSCRSMYWNEPRKTVLKEAVPSKREVHKEEYDKLMESAVERCLEGEGVLSVCSEMDVPVLEIIRRLVDRNFKYTL